MSSFKWPPEASGGGGGVNSVTASGPLASSGGANPNISLSSDLSPLVQIILPDGSAASPSLVFSSEPGLDTGFFFTGTAGQWGFSSQGIQTMTLGAGGDLDVTGNFSAANYPPTGPANTVAIYDSGNVLSSWNQFQRDSFSLGVLFNITEQPNNGTGYVLHSWNSAFDPLQNSPNESWLIHNLSVDIDPNDTGFTLGTNGQAITLINGGYGHNGTSDTGTLQYLNFNSNLGNGTDPITIKSLVGFFNGSNWAANTTIDGQLLGFGAVHNFNSSAASTANFSVTDFQIGHNIQIPVYGYISSNITPQILAIANNYNFTGYNLNPTITTFTGNAGFTGIAINGTYGTFGTGQWQGIQMNPTITAGQSAVGLSINMSNVTAFAGTFSSIVIQDLTLTFIVVGDNNNITIEFANDGTAGSETATFVFPNIVVHMQSGVSTATQIKAALDANVTILTNITTTISGVGSNPQVTQAATNFSGGANAATVEAINVIGNVSITGGLSFTGDLSIGRLSSFAQFTVPNAAGVVSVDTLITQLDVAAATTISGTDVLSVNTAALMNIGAGSTVTTSFLGWAALGLPAVLTVGAGSTIDRVGGAVFALSLGGGTGTVDIVSLCRALAIDDGTTTVNRLYGYEMSEPFGAVGTLAWGNYINADVDNWFKQSIKIGGTAGSTDVVSNSSVALEIESNTRALLLSRMTTVERDALTAINGMLIYNTTTDKFQGYEAGAWADLI